MKEIEKTPTEKKTIEFQLPKSVMKWVALGLVLSSSVVGCVKGALILSNRKQVKRIS